MHNVNFMRPAFSRIILSIAVLQRYRLFSHNVTEAYYQTKMRLSRRVVLQRKPEYFDIFGIKLDGVM